MMCLTKIIVPFPNRYVHEAIELLIPFTTAFFQDKLVLTFALYSLKRFHIKAKYKVRKVTL